MISHLYFTPCRKNTDVWLVHKKFIISTSNIAKYVALIRKRGGLYYTLLEVSMNKKALWKYVRVDDWADELAIIASYRPQTKFGAR